jgi:hypothetical protein
LLLIRSGKNSFVFSDNNLQDQEESEDVHTCLKIIKDSLAQILPNESTGLAPKMDIVLHAHSRRYRLVSAHDSDWKRQIECSYYIVNVETRTPFWLENFENSKDQMWDCMPMWVNESALG